jgi:two-component system nitrate/nitrite response regulator NarL
MRIRLLVADDDAQFRDTLRHLLDQRPEVTILGEAEDGEEALRLVGALRPDAVLMDLRMPRMSGLEATRQLKARWPDLPVVVLSVHDDAVYRHTALASGAEAFLAKKTLGTDLWPTVLRVAAKDRA